MTNRKRVFWATTALFSGLLVAGAASAQSSGTVATEATELDTVVVTGVRGPFTTDGTIVAETIAKTRSTITQEFISTQSPGQTILQTLNLVPGLNFVNADPFGNSGGNIRLRGFDGNRVSLTFDGIPLNDTGNYATFTNQQLDPELIERAAVNTGTTDVDSPTASATGGTINYTTSRPLEDMGAQVNVSFGEFNYRRLFTRFDTGTFGPWDTTAYFAFSGTDYDKFKGPGNLEKRQYNARLYQDLGNGNFASLSGHFNRNRNDFYNNFITQAQFNSGTYLEQDSACRLPTPGAGAQNDNTQATFTRSDGTTGTGSCTNFYGLRINPSNTGNVRGQFSYGLTDSVRFTFDPSFQYVTANGGNYSFAAETDNRFDQNLTNTNGIGMDLNGDGDVLDTVGIYAPSNTTTNRYGIISSLIWDVNEDHRIRAAYTLDFGRHRQTGEGILLGRDGRPANVFGGHERWGAEELRLLGRDGSHYRSRDRFSIAELNQFALEYRGQFFDDSVTINIGARAPFFRRELNQYCYSLNGTSTVRCTTEATTPDLTRPGNVNFTGTTGSFIAPFQAELKFDDILPSAGIVWRFAEGSSVYASYAEGISLPRTDNLYQPVRSTTGALDFSAVQPETTKTFDLGYRFRNDAFLVQTALWYTDFNNRIVSSRDNDPASPTFDLILDRNLGAVKQWGFDGQLGWNITDSLTGYVSASYNESEVQQDIFLSNFSCSSTTQVVGSTPACPTLPTAPLLIPRFLPTAGKSLVETPDWTFSTRLDWDVTEALSVGLQAKYVGDRFATDVNDEVAPAYTVVDFDARYDLTSLVGSLRDVYLQVNVTNLLDEEYVGNISSGNNATSIAVSADPRVPLFTGSARTYSVGSPRTAMISLGVKF
jgi:iron complex outermembrane receptor protein